MPRVVDIKCTARAEADWGIQVSAYTAMLGNEVTLFRDDYHRYYTGPGEEFISVTRLIRELGLKKSFAGLEMSPVVEHAANRGKTIEEVIFAAFSAKDTDNLRVPAEWRDELAAWWPGFWRWLDDYSPQFVDCRRFVGDTEIMVAGEIDLLIEGDGPPAVLHLQPRAAKGYYWREYPEAETQWNIVRRARLDAMRVYAEAAAELNGGK